MTHKNIAKHLDLTLLNPLASDQDIFNLIKVAQINNVYAVCLNSDRISFANKLIFDSDLKIASVVGFPSGAHNTEGKIAEAHYAILSGASEIDVVANIRHIKSHNWDSYQKEIDLISKDVHVRPGNIIKVIIESAMLTDEEIYLASQYATKSGADYVKTSTGYVKEGGASIEAVKIMLEAVAGKAKIKASGGIKTFSDAQLYLNFGVDRIGASSVRVLEENSLSSVEDSSY